MVAVARLLSPLERGLAVADDRVGSWSVSGEDVDGVDGAEDVRGCAIRCLGKERPPLLDSLHRQVDVVRRVVVVAKSDLAACGRRDGEYPGVELLVTLGFAV